MQDSDIPSQFKESTTVQTEDSALSPRPPESSRTSRKTVRTSILVSATGIGMFMGALDESIINVSLPTINNYFNVEPFQSQWIVLVYLLAIIGLTTIAGDLGDRFSAKNVFQIGMVIFTIGSLLCFFSWSLEIMIVFRIIQGIGATGVMANAMAIVTRFTPEEKRGLAIGLTSITAALGVVIGPVLGAILTQFISWQSIFIINIPVGIAGLIYVHYAIPATPPIEEKRQSDILGSVIFAFFMVLLIFGITAFANDFFAYPRIWSLTAIGLSMLLIVFFVFWERKVDSPFIDLSLFKNKKFSAGIISAVFAYIALNSVAFLLPFYFEEIFNSQPIEIGLVIIGVPLGLAITAPLSGKLSNKIETRYLTSFGLTIVAIILLCISFLLSPTLPFWIFILFSTIIGISIGIFTSPNGNSVLSSSPKEKLGVVSGLLSMSRIVGYSIGTSLSTTIFTFILTLLPEALETSAQYTYNYTFSMQLTFGIITILMAFSILVSYLRGKDKKSKSSEDSSQDNLVPEKETISAR